MDLALLARVLLLRRKLRQRERWNAPRLARSQTAQLALLRQHALGNSSFYRRFHRGLERAPLDQLPVLTKAELMQNFDELVTDPAIRLAEVRAHLQELTRDALFLDQYRVTRTSGSTGSPGIFLHSPKEWAAVLASYARAQEWAGIVPGLTRRTRLAVVSSRAPWHQSARVGVSVDSAFFPVQRFDATEPLPNIVAGLNAWQPDNLVAYASMARLLAAEQKAGRLHISPTAIMSAAELLTPAARAAVEQAFGLAPFNVYAATETASIASECSRHQLHLFEDLVICEVVDEQNRPVEPGAYGVKLLVTVLYSRTQPLIRYELSDRVAISPKRCDCGLGFSLLAGLEGRQEDILHLPALRPLETVAIHPNVFHAVLEPLPVQAWQVLHEADGLRILLVQPAPEIDLEQLASNVAQVLHRQGAGAIAVRVTAVESVTKTQTGKAPLVLGRTPWE